MKLIVENLIAVSKASIDLSKDLLVFTGENNSGKTYLTYLIYALYKPNTTFSEMFTPINIELDKEGFYTYNLYDNINSVLDNVLNQYLSISQYRNLHKHFALDQSQFQDTKIQFSGFENCISKEKYLDYEEEYDTPFGNKMSKKKNSPIIKWKKGENSEKDDLYADTIEANRRIILKLIFNNTYIFPSLREGIVLFNKELSIIKNKTFDKLLGATNGEFEMWSSLAKRFNRYPKPIKDSLEFAQNLDVYKKEKSEFAYLADELENTLLQGKIDIGNDGDVNFKIQNSDNAIEIHAVSSTIKSFSYLTVYLRHIAKKGDFIIIDEPELNLHPDNQRKLARFFGRLINNGFKLLISTHSDYITRELNNLIMLNEGTNKKPNETNELLKSYNYENSQLIDKERVGVYLFRQGKDVETIEVSGMGFNVPTIDEEINRLNQTTNDILFTIFEA